MGWADGTVFDIFSAISWNSKLGNSVLYLMHSTDWLINTLAWLMLASNSTNIFSCINVQSGELATLYFVDTHWKTPSVTYVKKNISRLSFLAAIVALKPKI